MLRSSRLVPLLTLVVGGLGGWAAASGRLDSMLRAESRLTEPSAPAVACSTAGGCCDSADKAAILASIASHNEKVAANRQKDGKKPNIVVIMGDDIGIWNIGAYHRGLSSGKTPNLDRLASQGMLFTDYYAEASCTAGRASFI